MEIISDLLWVFVGGDSTDHFIGGERRWGGRGRRCGRLGRGLDRRLPSYRGRRGVTVRG